MMHAFLLMAAFAPVQEKAREKADFWADYWADYWESVRIVEVRPAESELTLVDSEGESRTLHEGDLLPEGGGARVQEVSRATLVLKRVVSGPDGQKGEALVVVRFDRSGKTRVREYRTVPDVSPKTTPYKEHR